MQRKVAMKVKIILEENVKQMMSNINIESCCKIADLGCSSGPNALITMSNILNIMYNASLSLNKRVPRVFQIYLNDLFGNDFNSIIKLIPDFYQSIHQEKRGNFGTCFIHATPGSFYGRLFPDNYIHFFHSSYSLHWLSQFNGTSIPIWNYNDIDFDIINMAISYIVLTYTQKVVSQAFKDRLYLA